MINFPIDWVKILYTRFDAIYSHKFKKDNHDEIFLHGWWEQWSEGLAGIKPSTIKEALAYCRNNLDWPPSIAEFRRICEKSQGIPTMEQAFRAAIRRDFIHPIVAVVFDKIGTWDFKNDKESVLLPKFKVAYQEALDSFRTNPSEAHALLEAVEKRLALPEPPPKIPSTEERISFKERYKQWQEQAKALKETVKADQSPIPEWPKDKITIGHRNFDNEVFQQRRKFLLDMDEESAMRLPVSDQYDRVRFFREMDTPASFKSKNPYSGGSEREKATVVPFNSTKTVFKDWIN